MRFCYCGQPVFSTDKITKVGYCKSHQYQRTDTDKRTIMQRAIAKNKKEKQLIRTLNKYQIIEGIVDSLQSLITDIDYCQSRYVRLAAMGKDFKIECYCCAKRVLWTKAHLMHFINRANLATRFLSSNGKAGCYDCNVIKRGNLIVYAKKLNEEQPRLAEWLQEQSYTVANPTRSDLKEILVDYQFKLKLVEQKLL